MNWGGVWDIVVMNVGPSIEFNYMFTLVCVFGLIGVMVGMLVRLISRS